MLTLEKVSAEQEHILHNIMQFYIYEFSQYISAIKLEENGSYKPFNLVSYWEDPLKHAFLMKVDKELVGFVLIQCGQEQEPHSVNEFFVLKKFNGKGYGAQVATRIFDMFPGRWKITQIHNNYPAQAFWRKVINQYTNGDYKEYYDEARRSIQEFHTRSKF